MLLLTANESKRLAWVSRPIKNLPAHGIHLLFALRLLSLSPFLFLLLSSLSFRSSARARRRNREREGERGKHGRTAITANFRFGDATCQLPPRAASSPRVRDVYLPARSGIYRACEFRGAADLSNYTDRRPLSASTISAMSRLSDAVVDGRGERASFKCLRGERGEKLSVAIISATRPSCLHTYAVHVSTRCKTAQTRSLRAATRNYPPGRRAAPIISAIHPAPSLAPSRFHNLLTTGRGVSPIDRSSPASSSHPPPTPPRLLRRRANICRVDSRALSGCQLSRR